MAVHERISLEKNCVLRRKTFFQMPKNKYSYKGHAKMSAKLAKLKTNMMHIFTELRLS